MKRLHALLLALGTLFLAWMVFRIGPRELWHQFTLLGWGLVPLILLEGVADLFHALGWRHCLQGSHRSLSLFRIFQIRMAGFALNYLTPTASFGGEVAKAALLASRDRSAEAVSAVLVGKLCFGFAHLLFVVLGAGLILWQIELPFALWEAMLVSSVLLAAGMGTFFWLQQHGKVGGLVRWLVARKLGGKTLQRLAQGISKVDDSLKVFHRERRWDLTRAVGWHLIGYSVGIVQAWVFFRRVAPDASLLTAAGVFLLGMWFDLILFAVPTNVGVLEWSRVLTLRAVGGKAMTGLTYGLAIRLAQLFWAGFGLASYAWLASGKTGSPARQTLPKSAGDPAGQKDVLAPRVDG
jgi:uncharacterized protein (TIRG00374 family)